MKTFSTTLVKSSGMNAPQPGNSLQNLILPGAGSFATFATALSMSHAVILYVK